MHGSCRSSPHPSWFTQKECLLVLTHINERGSENMVKFLNCKLHKKNTLNFPIWDKKNEQKLFLSGMVKLRNTSPNLGFAFNNSHVFALCMFDSL